MLREAEFTQWMLDRNYPPLTPRHYLRDLAKLPAEFGISIEPVTNAKTDNILDLLRTAKAAEAAGSTDYNRLRNYIAAVCRYHEFSEGHLALGCQQRGADHADPK